MVRIDGEDVTANAATGDIHDQASQVAPVVWLLGKVQSGKSSIVHALTGASRAEIGRGFKACTTTSDVFDFPDDAPLIRFLDTRGLSEAGYDPSLDLEISSSSAHATIAVMRAMDPMQDAVVNVLTAIRKRRPDWPILVAQTSLHEGYASGSDHILPYPYAGALLDQTAAVPEALHKALTYQRMLFSSLPGTGLMRFVAIDFTLEGDGYTPVFYGLEELQSELADIAPAALRLALDDAQGGREEGQREKRMHRSIMGHAAAASAADLIPVAAVAAVPAVQARLLQTIANDFEVDWTRRTAAEFAGALGAGFLARYAAGFGIRQLTKLIPVYGQSAGAAAAAATSFATTYALGKAALYYLSSKQKGVVDTAAVQQVWASALREAFDVARARGLDDEPRGKP